MSQWIFVRHGQSVANAEGWLSGWEDVPLTSQGIEEARLAQKELEGEIFNRVLCSDLQRARHTAALILEGRPPVRPCTSCRSCASGGWAFWWGNPLQNSGKTDDGHKASPPGKPTLKREKATPAP